MGLAIVADAPITTYYVKSYCKQRLANYKVPEHVVFVEGLPYSETGKVVRRELVEMIQSQLQTR